MAFKTENDSLQYSVLSSQPATSLHINAFFQNASNVAFLFCHPRERGNLFVDWRLPAAD